MSIATLAPLAAHAEFEDSVLEVSGQVDVDVRLFTDNAIHAGQKNQRVNPSLVVNPEFSLSWNDDLDRIDFVPYLRLDGQDKDRTHADVRELKYLHIGEDWDLNVGADKVFWGVMESKHLVDIINQTDAVEDIDGEEKLGQPMANLGLQRDWGDVNLFVMPYFRERTFPGVNGRLRGATPVDTDQAVYESGSEEWHPDVAARYATVIGDWDLGLAYFHGTSREPRFVEGSDSSGGDVFIPYYDIIDQASIDAQVTIEEWLLKMESFYRTGHAKDISALSFGFEYTLFGLIDDRGDLGLLAEYHRDNRGGGTPSTQMDDDIFWGARVTLNDEDDTSFLGGVVVDRDSGAMSFSVEAERRLTDSLSLEIEGRASDGLTTSDPSYGARKDHHIQIRLSYYL